MTVARRRPAGGRSAGTSRRAGSPLGGGAQLPNDATVKSDRRQAASVAVSLRLRRWLLSPEADPSVRWKFLTAVDGLPERDPRVVRARKAIGRVGWVASILDSQLGGGQWTTPRTDARSLYLPKYIATNWRVIVLAELGASGTDRRIARALDLYLRVFSGRDGGELGGPHSEACVAGNAARSLILLGRGDDRRTKRALDWILRSQKADGGWHCFPSRTGTMDAWEPLAALATIPRGARTAEMQRAVERGAEFFLGRGLLKEGRGTYAPWLRLHYPNHYYYDFLLGLALLVRLGYGSDRRLRPALARLLAMRRPEGWWLLDANHPDVEGPEYVPRAPIYPFVLELPGRPSRWLTTTALEVLRGAERL